MTVPSVDLDFPHHWQAEILAVRPLILPSRHYTYPAAAEEVERGALEIMVNAAGKASPFLATCALGFQDPLVPTGLWSAPNPDEICALCGGYAYLIDTLAPERFTMLSLRPVLEVRVLREQQLLLFVGNRTLLAWGRNGLAWESPKLSDEGVTITSIDGNILHGRGWEMMTDCESPFSLNLESGSRS